MAFLDRAVTKLEIPVKRRVGSSSPLGRIRATVNLVTDQGRISGFNTRDGLIILANGNRAYAEHLTVSETTALAAGWPNNSGDVRHPTHQPTDYLK